MSGVRAAFDALDESRHRAELYRMWAAGHGAGLAHPASLEQMGARGSADAEEARQWLMTGSRAGRDVAHLVRTGGKRFEDFERALLTLGEESGHLDEALRLLADFFARKHKLMLAVKKRLAYPLVTALAACFIAPLPLLFFGRPGAYLAVALSGAALLVLASGRLVQALARRYGRAPALARARMARALATGVAAGLTLPRAVRLAAEASADEDIRAWVRALGEHRLATAPIGESLAGCPHLTPELAAVLATAERTGDFRPLTRLAELYEDGFR